MGEPVPRVSLWRWTTAGAVAAILFVTLRPIGSAVAPSFDWCIGCSQLGTLDLLYNIALFVPLGVALALRGAGALQALALCAALSLSIEVLQLVVIPGRDPTFGDVVANSLGGALGVPVSRARRFLTSASRTMWRIVTWCWVVLTVGVLVLGAWAVQVAVPHDDIVVQWLPKRPSYSDFVGELRSLAANGVQLPAGARISASQFPAAFFEGSIDVTAGLTPGSRRGGISLIARLVVPYGEFVMLGRQHDALVARYRAKAPRVGLRSPIYAFSGVFRGDPRRSMQLRVIKRGETLELRGTRASGTTGRTVQQFRITAARLWATLLPFDRGFGTAGVVADILWLALLVAPAAYAATCAYSGAWRFLPLFAQALGLALVAGILQPSLWWWPLWGGAVFGALAGYSLGRHRPLERRA